jgi:hypothetical protein
LKRLYAVRGWAYNAWQVAATLARSQRLAIKNRARLGAARYLLVRYEDIQRQLQKTMQAIVAFLGLDYDAALLCPTVNGLPATANSMYSERCVSGRVLHENQPRWRQELTTLEITAMCGLAAKSSKMLGYDVRASLLTRVLARVRSKLSRWAA